MHAFFSSERFGRPQVFAGILLLIFVAECAWLLRHASSTGSIDEQEFIRIEQGLAQWHGRGIAGSPSIKMGFQNSANTQDFAQRQFADYDSAHSPLWYLIPSAPIVLLHLSPESRLWIIFSRAPYVIFGALLGASLWYVSRRLYGNAGGYVALALYCFSPAVIRSSALWLAPPDIAPAWGTFGAVFTAVAVSHTLYAPREVVLWNWRRTILLGVSLALAIGSQFALAIVIPVLLAFMLYLAPARKGAASLILAAACAITLLLLFAAYFFHPQTFFHSLRQARLLEISSRSFIMPAAYRQLLSEIVHSGPVLILLIPAALFSFLLWPRTRYFGNAAPLMVAALFLVLRVLSPHASGSVFSLCAVLFFVVFVAGIATDLLETRFRDLVIAVLVGLIAANAFWNIMGLGRISP